MESIFDDDRNLLLPQNFNVAIWLVFGSMLLSIADVLYVSTYGDNFFIRSLQSLAVIMIFVVQGKYLRNFNLDIVSRWNKACIYTMAAGCLIEMPLYQPSSGELFYNLLILLSTALHLFNIICIAVVGYNMRKIRNDFVGGLRDLGSSYLYVYPLTVLLMTIVSTIKTLANDVSVSLLLTAVACIPDFKLLMVFIKARTYNRKTISITSESEP